MMPQDVIRRLVESIPSAERHTREIYRQIASTIRTFPPNVRNGLESIAGFSEGIAMQLGLGLAGLAYLAIKSPDDVSAIKEQCDSIRDHLKLIKKHVDNMEHAAYEARAQCWIREAENG